MAVSLLAALGRPRWWLLSLAAFLVRGGVLVLLLPIVSLPTTAGLVNAAAPTLVGFLFGGVSSSFLELLGIVGAAALVWLVGGGLLGAAIDVALIADVAGDEELEAPLTVRPGATIRAFAARFLTHLPTVGVLLWAAVRLVPAIYSELIAPGNPAVPVVLRVVARVPDVVIAVVVAWAACEAVGGLAVRRVVAGDRLAAALGRAWRDVVRRPTTLATTIVTDAVVAAVILAASGVSAVAWNGLRIVIVDGGAASEVWLALAIFSVSWLAGAWLLAIAAAWRQVAWTFEALRERRS